MGVMALRQAILEQRLLLLDTMVWIYLLDAHPHLANLAAVVLNAVEQGEVAGVVSSVTLAELLTAPAQSGDKRAMQDYELYVTHFPNLTIVPCDVAVARLAAQVRGRTGLRLPDAIVLATGQYAGAGAVVSNDKRWRGKTGNMTLLLLEDFLE